MEKSAVIKLTVEKHGHNQEFDIAHAERLLRMNNNGGWRLPKDSEYTFSLKHGIRLKSNKRSAEVTEKQKCD